MQQDKTFLGTEPVGKLLWRLGVPTVIAQLVNMLYNIVDRIYIGHMPVDGSLALTGVGVCMPLILIVSAFCGASWPPAARPARPLPWAGDNDAEAEKILGGCFMLQTIIVRHSDGGDAAVEPGNAACVRSQRKYHRLSRWTI